MTFVDLLDVRMFFTDEGAGDPPMVFVHGFSCDSHDWSWQLPHFAVSHRVIALDLRGHGRSSAPDDDYTVSAFVADVAALIEQLACGPVVAVGHSMGGAVVGALAGERPDLVQAVVAVDPAHLLPDEAGPGMAAALEAYRQDPIGTIQTAFDGGYHPAATPPALATWHNRRAAGMSENVLTAMMTGLLGGEPPYILRSGSEPRLSQVKHPVLSFYTDPAPAAIAAEVFRGPGSRVVCFEGSGHWLHQERPAELNSIIDQWLAELDMRPQARK